ncbi:hypothetical protein G6F57_018174 [Rhizopus arrhizus]|nr:hypothetical protein G6F57_018174 [Rhizopus arrhizus]
MRVERGGMDAVVEAIHRHFDGLAQHGAAQPAGEGGQHPDLAARKLQSLPTYRGLARGGVEQQPADTHRLYLHAARPAPGCPDPREQFLQREGLGQVVVGPFIQAGDAVRQLSQRTEHDDRYPGVVPAQDLNQAQPVTIGQGAVQQHQIVRPGKRRFAGQCQRVGQVHHVALALQGGLQGGSQCGFVFDQQDVHRRESGGKGAQRDFGRRRHRITGTLREHGVAPQQEPRSGEAIWRKCP